MRRWLCMSQVEIESAKWGMCDRNVIISSSIYARILKGLLDEPVIS
jgi:hypothetical protein